jgi:hypothetical protein
MTDPTCFCAIGRDTMQLTCDRAMCADDVIA